MYRLFSNMLDIHKSNKVIEYGCGSLRVGAHFIRHLDRGNFVGLDVTRDFIEHGLQLIGDDLLQTKVPYVDAISEQSLDLAERHKADLVYSTACAFHVHPEDKPKYIADLLRLTSKPGARLIFDTKLSFKSWRYATAGWVRTAGFYIETLNPLRLVDFHTMRESPEAGARVHSTVMVFQRD